MVRFFFYSVLLLFTVPGSAHELLNYLNSRYIIRDSASGALGIPNIQVETEYRTHYVKIFKVCRDGEWIKTTQPIKTCRRFDWPNNPQCSEIGSPMSSCQTSSRMFCAEEEMQFAMAPVRYQRKVCADIWDPESAEWRRRYGSDEKRFRKDCPVEKTIEGNRKIAWKFEIYDRFLEVSARYDKSVGGTLIKQITFEIPNCK